MGDVKLNSSGGGSVTLTTPSTASNLTVTLPSASGTLATTSGTGSVFTNPTINGFTGDTSVVNIGSGQFYKDTSGNVGIGTSSPGAQLDVTTSTNLAVKFSSTNANGAAAYFATGLGAGYIGSAKYVLNSGGTLGDFCVGAGTNNNLIFSGNGLERMRLDSSGNLGIGTASPKEKLDSRGAAVFSGDNATGTNAYGTAAGILLSTSSDNTKARITAVSNGANSISLVLRPLSSGSGVDAVTIDPSGNLGLGVAPSGWGSGNKAIDLGNNANISGSTSITSWNNAYYNGSSVIYKNSAAATYYQQTQSGIHTWAVAPSGTAGNAISFTQAMTLDASGNLGVGLSNPSDLLHLHSTSGLAVLRLSGGASSSVTYQLRQGITGVSNAGFSLYDVTNGATRLAVDSGGYFFRCASGSFTSGQSGWQLRADTGTIQLSNSGTTQSYVAYFYNGNGTVGTISTSGSATTYSTSSDLRLKTNIAPAGSAIQSILDFPVDQFDWVADGTHQDFGAVAQKAINVIPEMVSVPNDPDDMWGIDWSKAVPRLIRAYQELSAKNSELESRLAALEGK